jgi:hypothetical protein
VVIEAIRDGGCVEHSDEGTHLTTPSRLALDDLLAKLLRRTREVVDVRDGRWKLLTSRGGSTGETTRNACCGTAGNCSVRTGRDGG